MTSSDLKQERLVFHRSVSTFLQLVVVKKKTTICGNLKFSCGFMPEASPGRDRCYSEEAISKGSTAKDNQSTE